MRTYQLKGSEPTEGLEYDAQLNEQQRRVVLAGEGAHLVIAGAGSGKTRTLTYRVARLIETGCDAASIALCTFTNKAAREMIDRVEHLVQGEVRRVWGGTFHHLANRLLRDHASKIGYDASYTILDQEDANDLLGDCLAEESPSKRRGLGLRPAVVGGLIGLAVNTLTPLEDTVLLRAPRLVQRLDEITAVARAYRDRKRSMNVMDFDDLLYNLFLLLEDQESAAPIAGRFRHVLVDEYQDTSPLQCELVNGLAAVHGNISVVGDDAQSIYGFRGADPQNMQRFSERWPQAELHKLEVNYRSSPQVLDLANASIAHNPNQVPKKLVATVDPGLLPASVPVRDAQMEAAFVAQRVCELAEEGIGLAEQAVLYRAHHHSMELQVELTRRDIPYRVRSGVRFFEQAHIKDVLAHLRVVANPQEALSWLRLLRLQPGIGRGGANRIWERLASGSDPLVQALSLRPQELGARNRVGFESLKALLTRLAEEANRASAASAIETVLEAGYDKRLPELYNNPDSRRDDIVQLAQYADRFDDVHGFLSELNLLAGFASETVLEPGEPEELLTLTTIHQAKGLEWQAVFLLSLNEGAFPHPRSIHETGGLEEERRLFYVALTRAKLHLYLLSRQVEDRRGQNRILLQPSRFVAELGGRNLFEHWRIEG